MAPEEMAGPRYRGLGMSRWARTVTLETNRSRGRKYGEEVKSTSLSSLPSLSHPRETCPWISMTSRELK